MIFCRLLYIITLDQYTANVAPWFCYFSHFCIDVNSKLFIQGKGKFFSSFYIYPYTVTEPQPSFFFHPHHYIGMLRYSIHQAATTSHLTFVWWMCKRQALLIAHTATAPSWIIHLSVSLRENHCGHNVCCRKYLAILACCSTPTCTTCIHERRVVLLYLSTNGEFLQ